MLVNHLFEWRDIMQKGLLSISSKEYRSRMLTGRDIVTGSSSYSTNTQARIQNLGGIPNSGEFENHSRTDSELLCRSRIEDLKARINNGGISYLEKQTLMDSLVSLREEYAENFGKGLSKSTKR